MALKQSCEYKISYLQGKVDGNPATLGMRRTFWKENMVKCNGEYIEWIEQRESINECNFGTTSAGIYTVSLDSSGFEEESGLPKYAIS